MTADAAARLHAIIGASEVPPPVSDERCPSCSDRPVPAERAAAARISRCAPPHGARMINVLNTLYVTTQNARVHLEGESLACSSSGGSRCKCRSTTSRHWSALDLLA